MPSRPSLPRPVLLACATTAAAALAAPAAAQADAIAFIQDHNVWLASPDGAVRHQVTLDGTADAPYRSPSQADDGTLVAVRLRNEIVRLRQSGEVLNRISPPPAATSNGGVADAVATAAISPDGATIAYALSSYTCPVASTCGARTVTGYTAADRLTDRAERSGAIHYGAPSWVTNGRTLVFGGYGAQVNVHDLGPGTVQRHWYDDQELLADPAASGEDQGDGELTRQGDKLAVVRSYGANARIHVLRTSGDPRTDADPANPVGVCESAPVEGTNGPTWSPDGSALAWADPRGITIARGIPADSAGCAAVSETVAFPGASEPDWGPAAIAPGPRPSTGSGVPGGGTTAPPPGGSGGSGGGTPAPRLTVSGATVRLATLRRRGVVLPVRVPGPGRLTASAKAGGRTVLRGTLAVRRGGAVALRLRLASSAAARRVRGRRLAVRVTFRPASGATIVRTVTVRVR